MEKHLAEENGKTCWGFVKMTVSGKWVFQDFLLPVLCDQELHYLGLKFHPDPENVRREELPDGF